MLANQHTFKLVEEKLKNFIASPASLAKIGAITRELGGSDFTLPNLSNDAVMPDSSRLDGVGVWDRVYTNDVMIQNKIVRESRKQAASLLEDKKRFEQNQSQNLPDPVFKSKEEMDRMHSACLTDLYYAKAFADPPEDVKEKLGDMTNILADRYLEQSQHGRLYSRGILDSTRRTDLDGLNRQDSKRFLVHQVGEFLSCSEENRHLENFACNVFLHKALEKIYDIDDFKPTTDSNNNIKMRNANEMIAYMQSSEKWKEIGPCSAQKNLDRGGLLAAQGKAVVVTWFNPESGNTNHGHVAILHPGPPTGQSGTLKWKKLRVPQIANFSYTNLGYTSADIKITYAFGPKDPKDVILYYREY